MQNDDRKLEVITAWRRVEKALGTRYEGCRVENFQISDDDEIGESQRRVRDSVWDYCRHMPEAVGAGQGLLLFGSAGTGKDHLLSACLRAAALKHLFVVHWVNGMDLYGDLRDLIGEDKITESAFLSRLIRPDILAISDPLPPGDEPLTKFQSEMLSRVLDARYRRGRPIWVTVNVSSRQELNKRMGATLADRIVDKALTHFCHWPSHRQPARAVVAARFGE
jgi:DNA replication protein DnaC